MNQNLKVRKSSRRYSSRHSGESDDSRIPTSSRLRRAGDSGQARMTLENMLLFLFIALLPTQLGKHFFLPFSYISGVRVDYLAPALYLTDIIVLVLAVLNWRIFLGTVKNRFLLPLLFLLLIHSTVFAQSPSLAYYRLLKIVEVFFVFFLIHRLKPNQHLVLWSFLSGLTLQVILSVWQFAIKSSVQGFFYFFGERAITLSTPDIAKASLQGVEILRPYGTFSHPNSLAGFYLLIYTYVLTLQTKYNWLKKTILFGASILIFMSFSKVAIALFVLVNFIYVIQKEFFNPVVIMRSHRRRSNLMMRLLRTARNDTCWLCIVSQILVLSVLAFIFTSAQTDPLSLDKRILFMNQTFSTIKENLFAGVGLGHHVIALSKLPVKYFISTFQPVHNIFLYVLSEIGIVLFGILLIFGTKQILRRFSTVSFGLCFLVVFLTGFVDHYWITLQQNFLLLGVIFGLLES